MNNSIAIRELNLDEVCQVNGGLVRWGDSMPGEGDDMDMFGDDLQFDAGTDATVGIAAIGGAAALAGTFPSGIGAAAACAAAPIVCGAIVGLTLVGSYLTTSAVTRGK